MLELVDGIFDTGNVCRIIKRVAMGAYLERNSIVQYYLMQKERNRRRHSQAHPVKKGFGLFLDRIVKSDIQLCNTSTSSYTIYSICRMLSSDNARINA